MVLAIFLIVLAFFIPESPKFYYAKKRFSEARAALKKVSRYNGNVISQKTINYIVFDTEVQDDAEYVNMNGEPLKQGREKTEI